MNATKSLFSLLAVVVLSACANPQTTEDHPVTLEEALTLSENEMSYEDWLRRKIYKDCNYNMWCARRAFCSKLRANNGSSMGSGATVSLSWGAPRRSSAFETACIGFDSKAIESMREEASPE